jgi:hypothetical protein
MPDISFPEAALDKVVEDRRHHAPSGSHSLVPRLLYHHRSYSTLRDGRTIERGPGLSLSFIAAGEVENGNYLLMNRNVTARSSSVHRSSLAAVHEIDWVDRKFTLKSSGFDNQQ